MHGWSVCTRSAPGRPHARLSDRPTGCLQPWWGVPGWRNGRRGGLKIRCLHGRGGSSPPPGTASTLARGLSTGKMAELVTERGLASALLLCPRSNERDDGLMSFARPDLDLKRGRASHHEVANALVAGAGGDFEVRIAVKNGV